jgi:hypothetical protein
MALTADQVHAQVHDMRAQAATVPEKVELGKMQRDALEQAARDASGLSDVGPLREFQGMPVVKSRREDHVKLLAANEAGEDVEVDVVPPPAQPAEVIAGAEPGATMEAAP